MPGRLSTSLALPTRTVGIPQQGLALTTVFGAYRKPFFSTAKVASLSSMWGRSQCP